MVWGEGVVHVPSYSINELMLKSFRDHLHPGDTVPSVGVYAVVKGVPRRFKLKLILEASPAGGHRGGGHGGDTPIALLASHR